MSDPAAAVVAGWRQAEERLYPLVMVDPDGFQRVVSVIRAAADRLGDHVTTDDLVEARRRGREVVVGAAESVGVQITQITDIDLVADAAFGLRHREALAARRRTEVADRIAAAREKGHDVVVIRESGRPDHPAVQPFERIEMRLADGRGLRASVDVDPSDLRPVYMLDQVALDPETGLLVEDPHTRPSRRFTHRESWEAARQRWRSGHRDPS